MQKSQRIGLLILALLCVATLGVSVWRSRTACERLGLPTPHPSDFTVLSVAPPAERQTKAASDSVASAKGKRKGASGGKRPSSKHTKDTGQPAREDRRWLDEL